mgnify:CR=1 FL=1
MYWISILIAWSILWYVIYRFYNIKFSWRMLIFPLLIYIMLNVLDFHSTYLCVELDGIGGEQNTFLLFATHFFDAKLMTIAALFKIFVIFVPLPIFTALFGLRYAYATLLSSNLMFAFIVSANYYAYYKMTYS